VGWTITSLEKFEESFGGGSEKGRGKGGDSGGRSVGNHRDLKRGGSSQATHMKSVREKRVEKGIGGLEKRNHISLTTPTLKTQEEACLKRRNHIISGFKTMVALYPSHSGRILARALLTDLEVTVKTRFVTRSSPQWNGSNELKKINYLLKLG